MTAKLTRQVAVVTGASRGIGASIAKHLAAHGASVVVNYRSHKDEANAVASHILQCGGTAITVKADVRNEFEINDLFAAATDSFGAPNIVVNNAGVYTPARLSMITEDIFHSQFAVNVLGVILVSKVALKYFGPSGGSIINIGSAVSTTVPAGIAVYNATKAAVDALTRTFAKELAPLRIRVNSVNPGLIDTEGLRAAGFSRYLRAIAAIHPPGGLGTPEDVAPAVTFLASQEAAAITGETINIATTLNSSGREQLTP
jgi:3-oxoacyl-[acyl-carrier protein] reductase